MRATPGTTELVPIGAPHAFRNVGSGPARHVAITTDPCGAQMVEELGKVGAVRYSEI